MERSSVFESGRLSKLSFSAACFGGKLKLKDCWHTTALKASREKAAAASETLLLGECVPATEAHSASPGSTKAVAPERLTTVPAPSLLNLPFCHSATTLLLPPTLSRSIVCHSHTLRAKWSSTDRLLPTEDKPTQKSSLDRTAATLPPQSQSAIDIIEQHSNCPSVDIRIALHQRLHCCVHQRRHTSASLSFTFTSAVCLVSMDPLRA